MAGLVPAIHAFYPLMPEDVDARDKRGHDKIVSAYSGSMPASLITVVHLISSDRT